MADAERCTLEQWRDKAVELARRLDAAERDRDKWQAMALAQHGTHKAATTPGSRK